MQKTNRFVFKQLHFPVKRFKNDSIGDNNIYFYNPFNPPPIPLQYEIKEKSQVTPPRNYQVGVDRWNQRVNGAKLAGNTTVSTSEWLRDGGGG